MFHNCMFCKKTLGANEVVETFPVGRRLAFDATRGRLWVVCRRCGRWNLTPLEERWEAIEDCERLFRETPMRASTVNIGVARLREGLELVRIGKPLRAEFAAWRYGDGFGRRRQRYLVRGTAAAILAGGVFAGSIGIGLAAAVGFQFIVAARLGSSLLPRGRFRPDDGRLRLLNRRNVYATRIVPANDDLGLHVGWRSLHGRADWFEGDDARRALDAVLPLVNSAGASRRSVQDAVKEIQLQQHAQGFLAKVARRGEQHTYRGVPGYLVKLPRPVRLALEMALHEAQERRALEGELWLLERAWKEAEEIAAISDNLFLPAGAGRFLDRHRERR
ncbi:MAG: hypothetical protein OXI71_10755 [Gemmatimonadota bacterium]|nr:hypothetical protein [Gemmatimonadota bacterium]